MGCVCSAEYEKPKESIYDGSYITIRFSDDESPCTTAVEPLQYYTKENIDNFSPLSTIPDTQKSLESFQGPRLHKSSIPGIMSGELMKYHPGLSSHFISRFCILTKTEFKYFKSLYSYTLTERPLLNLPISSIESVSLAAFYVPEKALKFSKSNNLYQFEIFIRDEDEMTKLSRETDHVPIDSQVVLKSSVLVPEDSVEDGKLMKRPVRQESPTRSYNKVDRISWSFREIEWCTAEKRLLFSAKNQEDALRWVNEIKNLIN